MKKLVGFLLLTILFAFVPLGSIDYSSKFSGFFILLGNFQVAIIDILTLLMTISTPILLSILSKISTIILAFSHFIVSLPYHLINPWYVLLLLFLTSYFFEKFRFINNELNKLQKKISKQNSSNDNNQDLLNDIKQLTSRADDITKLLSQISSAAESLKPSHDRTKKIRRNETIINNPEDSKEKQIKKKVKKKTLKKKAPIKKESKKLDENEDSSKDIISNDPAGLTEEPQTDEILNDDNISKIDLVRALIDTNEKDKAKELLEKIVETGAEDEKHEARLLHMQIK